NPVAGEHPADGRAGPRADTWRLRLDPLRPEVGHLHLPAGLRALHDRRDPDCQAAFGAALEQWVPADSVPGCADRGRRLPGLAGSLRVRLLALPEQGHLGALDVLV